MENKLPTMNRYLCGYKWSLSYKKFCVFLIISTTLHSFFQETSEDIIRKLWTHKTKSYLSISYSNSGYPSHLLHVFKPMENLSEIKDSILIQYSTLNSLSYLMTFRYTSKIYLLVRVYCFPANAAAVAARWYHNN